MVNFAQSIIFVLNNILSRVTPAPIPEQICPSYDHHSRIRHEGNRLIGMYQLPFQRPVEKCRNFYSHEVEEAIERLRKNIADPDLFRLFANAYPNTLDTMVKWKGFAHERGEDDEGLDETDEDLAFIITGDMCVASRTFIANSTDLIISQKCHVASRFCKSNPLVCACPYSF